MSTQATPAQVIVVQSPKSPGVAAILGFFLGPLGLLYSTVAGAVTMFFVNLVIGLLTLGLGLILTWPVCALWGYVAAKSHNARIGVRG